MTRSELEAKLLAQWSRETLAAYGAVLRAEGDPRGELIAIDLGAADDDRKAELEAAWLGDSAEAVTTRFGFVEDCLDLEAAMPALDHVLRYARAFELHGEPGEVVDALAVLPSQPRPWLGALAIEQSDSRTPPLIDAALAERVVAATPNLRSLAVRGHRVFATFAHPRVERLAVDGHDALPALVGRDMLPAVVTLDFALHPDAYIEREPTPDELRALLPAAAFPQLRTLDLWRNEPRESTLRPNCLGDEPPFDTRELPTLWPLLEDLELASDDPTALFQGFTHPRVRRMRITGLHALDGVGAPWPALHALDFAFGGGVEAPDEIPLHLRDAHALPALRALDLSRNEPSADMLLDRDAHRFQGLAYEVYEVLGDMGVLAKLVELRVPSLRSVVHVRALQAALDRMPALERLEVVRLYEGAPRLDLRHPRAQLVVPTPCSWPPMDQMDDNAQWRFEGVELRLHSVLFALEAHYTSLAPAAQAAWDEIFAAHRQARRKLEVSAATLFRACDALAQIDDYLIDDDIDELADAIRGLAISGKTVSLKLG